MSRVRQAATFGITLVAGLVFGTVPVAAAGYDSTTEALIRTLNTQLTVIALPITVFVLAVLLYTVLRFRGNDEPKPTGENRNLEISWTVATALILVVVGVLSYQVMADPSVTTTQEMAQDAPEDAVEVTLVGHQWYWEVQYPDENITIQNVDTIYLPVDRPVYITVTSGDVIHSVHVPDLGLKADAIPGQRSFLQTRILNEGEYQLYCAEFCGAGHSKMTAVVKGVPEDEYEQWLEQQQNSTQ